MAYMVHVIKLYGFGQDMQTKGEIFTMFHFKEVPRGSLLEKAVLSRFGLYQISQQLRLGNQAHAPTQTRFQWNYLCANQFKYQESKQLYTRHLQSMDRATIHHLHDKSLHGFSHIKAENFIQRMKHFFVLQFIYFVFTLFYTFTFILSF